MKTINFNINDYVLVEITEYGWEHLKKTVGNDYITHCILSYEETINGRKWYKLQGHQMITLFGKLSFVDPPIKMNIKIEVTE